MIAVINILLDWLAKGIFIFIPLFWGGMIFLNTVTGRFKKKWVLWQWPAHEEVVPPSPKVMHGVHLTAMIVLGLSGLYIRYPAFYGGREIMRYLHYIAMYIVVANMVSRIYYAYLYDGKEFLLTKKDIMNTPNVLLYYAHLRAHYPHLAKYNPMQKMTYSLFFPGFMIIQAISGFALLWPKYVLFLVAAPAGGLASAVAFARVAHFFSAMMLIMFTGIHMFLALNENFPSFLDFFGIVPITEGHGHGEDHGDAHGEMAEAEHHELPEGARLTRRQRKALEAQGGAGAVAAFADAAVDEDDLEPPTHGAAGAHGAAVDYDAARAQGAARDVDEVAGEDVLSRDVRFPDEEDEDDEEAAMRLAVASSEAGGLVDEEEEEEEEISAVDYAPSTVKCHARGRLKMRCRNQALPGSLYCAVHQHLE